MRACVNARDNKSQSPLGASKCLSDELAATFSRFCLARTKLDIAIASAHIALD